ncbi:MAG: RhoGAP-domain-containing protein [Benniella sp.]|nr:MAG: RhoGAP-domain-containing protein [Benniella sp.]
MFGDNLDSVSILVVGSGIKVNDKGREILMFFVSVGREVVDNAGPSPHREEDELWRVEKQYIDFVNLDSKLRITQSRNVVNNLPKLPDKSLFSTNAPSKADARKVALEQYMQQLTSIRFKDTRDLCEFLRTGLVERGSRKEGKEAGWKEGYLTKRGKNFGGWKTRFFVLRGPVLEYFDTKDGHHLGSIALTYAQIGRQQAQDKQDGGDSTNDPNSYRHAFLILEPKKGQTVADAKRNPNSVMRHVLCAETDEERDEWVEALLVHVGKEAVEQAEPVEKERVGRRMPEIQKVSATPIKELASSKGNEKLLLNQEAYERQQRTVPGSPSAQQFIAQGRGGNVPQSPTLASTSIEDRHSQERQSAEGQYPSSRSNYNQYNDQDQQQGSWGQQQSQQQQQQQQQYYNQQQQGRNQSSQPQTPAPAPAPAPQLTPDQVAEKEKKQRSRMTFHWPKKSTKDEGPIQLPQATQQPAAKDPTGTASTSSSQGSGLRNLLGMGGGTSNAPPQGASGQGVYQSSSSIRQVFGVSLEQAIEQAIVQPGYELPAVVYRCIEYLNAHNAKMEEGIYRLNGSATIIKNLKDRFNHEGDVPLLSHDEYYDVHAIAGLLKLFLRELPSSVLTRELHKEFLQVIELTNRSDRVGELTRLVASLPEANYTILRALTAHLIEIVDNSDVNKMTARNVGIVFSPTLGISAGVFALLMSDFDQIFHTNDGRIMPLENGGMRNVGDPNALLDA